MKNNNRDITTLTERRLTFQFPKDWKVAKFDEWMFYKKHFQKIEQTKAVDFIAVDPHHCLWLIEIKDYRLSGLERETSSRLHNVIAWNTRDTLAVLAAAQINADKEPEKAMARAALECTRMRIVFHFEQNEKPSKNKPLVLDFADVNQKLKQMLKAIDPHPMVMDMKIAEELRMRNKIGWSVVTDEAVS